jgi:hypothetical protein
MHPKLQQLALRHAREYAALMVGIVGESMSLDAAATNSPGHSARVRDYLAAHPGSTSAEIRQALGLTVMQLHNTLGKLTRSGQVSSGGVTKRKRYRLALREVKAA